MASNKNKCRCGKIAVWIYMPGGSNSFFCDDCVPRGCSCNFRPLDGNWENGAEENWAPYLDEKGREYPCCEFEYEKHGFDLEDYH